MQRNINYIAGFCLLLLLASCKKDLESQFRNPEVYSKTENLFPGIFLKMIAENKVYSQDYGEYYWQLNAGTEVPGYAQISQRYITDRYAWFSTYNDLSGVNSFGANTDNLWNQRLDNFYTRARYWVVLKTELDKLDAKAAADNKIYYTLATVVKDYAALLNVDFYNSIPYFDAFKGNENEFFPKYDDPLSIYKAVLHELDSIATALPATYAGMSSLAKDIFQQQDIALKGNLDSWLQYINALRLKYAVRISGVDEVTAKTHLQSVLSRSLPATDLLWNLTTEVAPESNGFWLRGMYENYYGTFIPDVIMRRLNKDTSAYDPGIDDPRLPVLAMPTKFFKGEYSATVNKRKYIGVSYNADAQKPGYVAGDRYVTSANNFASCLQQNAKSQYNYTTFMHNANFPAYMMSLAEVDLLLAEVALKGLGNTGKTAGEHIRDAISHSVDFWYNRNAESKMASSFVSKAQAGNYFVGPLSFSSGRFGEDSALYFHPSRPLPADLNKFADSMVNRFNTRAGVEDKMEILMQQKYIHLNIMCPYELWTELRRTRHPYLEPFTFSGAVMKPMPERLRYPRSALSTNPQEYLKVMDQDNFTTPIFWVPTDKRNVNPYWANYNYE